MTTKAPTALPGLGSAPIPSSLRWAALGAIVAVHASLLFLYHVPEAKSLAGDEQTYERMARLLAAGEAARLDYLWPPFYGRFLAWILKLGGGSLWAIQAVQTALLVVIALLVRDLSRRFLGSRLGGDLAAFCVLAYPPLVAFAHYLWPEILHMALFLGALWVVVARAGRWLWMPVLGAFLGLALLTKSILGPFLPILLVPQLLRGTSPRDGLPQDHLPGRVLRAGLALAVLLAVIAPTVIANRRATGKAMIADSSWFNLWVGLNDRSRKSLVNGVVEDEYWAFQKSAPTFAERNEVLKGKVRDFVREQGPVRIVARQAGKQYFRLFDKDSYLTEQLPGGALRAVGQGYQAPPRLLAWGLRFSSYAFYAVILVAAAAGLALFSPRRHPYLVWVLVFFAYNFGIFLLLHVKSRYRVQMLPFFFVYAGATVGRWLEDRFEGEAPARWQRWLAGIMAVAALGLAFGGPFLDRV